MDVGHRRRLARAQVRKRLDDGRRAARAGGAARARLERAGHAGAVGSGALEDAGACSIILEAVPAPLGKLVAEAKSISPKQLYQQYQTLFMEALKLKTTVKKNINVFQHMMGYFQKQLSTDEKHELLERFNQYREGYIPLIVPLTLIKHYVRKYDQPYLKQQVYLNPHPIELKLRNHA